MQCALNVASPFLGAPNPNPCVGAAGFDKDDQLIYAAAHTKQGEAHAEAKIIDFCRQQNCLDRLHTLAITLEPCNHHGLTPPCTDSILQSGIQNIIIGLHDPNPKASGGIERLELNGRNVISSVMPHKAFHQMADFMVKHLTGLPLVILKIAINEHGDMIPDIGQTTFTNQNSLTLAHRLRKRSDSLLTGSGTILTDMPGLTVRHVPDFVDKKRQLIIMDRRGRVNETILNAYNQRGFKTTIAVDIKKAIAEYKDSNALLIEAGPQISKEILTQNLWDIAVLFKKNNDHSDTIYTGLNPEKPLLESLNPFNIYDFLPSEPNVINIATENISDSADTLRRISSLCF